MNRLVAKANARITSRYQDSNIQRLNSTTGPEDDYSKPDKTYITYDTENKVFRIYLTSTITGPEDYINVFDTFVVAEEDEQIIVYLATQGGRLDTTNIIRGLADKCKASTLAIIGDVASAGTILALSFDDIEVLPNIEFMIHNYSGGSGGKGHEIYSHVDFLKEEMPKVFQDFYKDFLTPEECNLVISGQDLYLNAEQVAKRWDTKCTLHEQRLLQESMITLEDQLDTMVETLQEQGYKVTKLKTTK